MRVAVNLFAAGQETTVRLLGSALQLIAERPDIQEKLRAEHDQIPDFVEEMLRYESPVKGELPARPSRHDGGRRRHPGRYDRDAAQRRRQPRRSSLR